MRPEPRLALAVLLALAATCACAGDKTARVAKAGALSEDGRANIALAQAYLNAGRVKEAEGYAREALKSDGGSGAAHATMALVRARQNQPDQATAEFNRALALAPTDGGILNVYGVWLCERGDRDGADNAFRAALADQTYMAPVQPLVNAGRCALLAQQWAKSDGYLRRALQIQPNDRSVLLMLAEAQLRLQKPMEARAFVQRSDALGPDPVTLALAAKIEEASGDAMSAERYRKRLREEFPQYAPTGEGAGKP
jgi:type IV pilus assembly protein PilF